MLRAIHSRVGGKYLRFKKPFSRVTWFGVSCTWFGESCTWSFYA